MIKLEPNEMKYWKFKGNLLEKLNKNDEAIKLLNYKNSFY